LDLCPGDTTILHAPTDSVYSYQWLNDGDTITGAVSASLPVASGGQYSVILTLHSCVNASTPDSVLAVTPPAPFITGSNLLCPGNVTVLSTTTDSAYTYQWLFNGHNIPGADSSFYAADSVGAYSVIESLLGCGGRSNSISVILDTIRPAISSDGVTLTASPGLFYEWYSSGIAVAGATQQTYTPATSGTYTVAVQDSSGCSQQSLPFSFTTGINAINGNADIQVYPNPVKDVLTIVGDFAAVDASADLYDMDGRIVQVGSIHSGSNNVALQGITAGVYVLKITSGNGDAKIFRIVVE
jgi:hypothetical protein